MCTRSVESKCAALLTALAVLGVADSAGAQGYPAKFDFGVPASAEDIATVAIAIRPDGQGLPAGKGFSPNVVVYGPDGGRVTMLSWGAVGDSLTTFTWKGQLAHSPGSYRIVFTDERGGALLERTIAVANGRSSTVPALP